MVRSFLSFHAEAPLEEALAFARARAGGAGVYLVPDPPWVSLYHEALEAQEDPGAIRGFLRELSRLGRALAFLVLAEEDLLFLLAEGGRVRAELRRGPELGEALWGPEDLLPLLEAAQAMPPLSAVRALAAPFGLHPDHAALGFLDLLEAEEEEGLPEEVVYLE
ncbi:hypothetical protein [Thermus thermamylovorans]|uniref:Uncharacterized protein n=1 Tax=Thermus thermamylovorans TaxID=2509362 RepID=A0A4Q9AZJ8_9DEIN|nr:hypothetical protein [Thermus thermamylovorans]TBH17600.1 hypothetical protein ETP66_08425 [Thermus thermamylovorans]